MDEKSGRTSSNLKEETSLVATTARCKIVIA
jgi:hypothetical protein